MAISEHPRVTFRTDDVDELNIAFGYLAIIDGVPWLAATEEEAKGRIPATMQRLEAQHLVETTNEKTGEHYFVYQATLHRHL